MSDLIPLLNAGINIDVARLIRQYRRDIFYMERIDPMREVMKAYFKMQPYLEIVNGKIIANELKDLIPGEGTISNIINLVRYYRSHIIYLPDKYYHIPIYYNATTDILPLVKYSDYNCIYRDFVYSP